MSRDLEAIGAVVGELATYAGGRMTGTRADALAWEDKAKAAPAQIIAALLEAGFVVRPISGEPVTRVAVSKGRGPYRRRVRVEADIPENWTVWAEIEVEVFQVARDPAFPEYIARGLADRLGQSVKEGLFERIARPIMQHDYAAKLEEDT